MNVTVGSPSTTINESAGWGLFTADMSAYAGQQTELIFHLDSDSSVQYTGFAVDDVTVTACQVAGAPPNIDVAPLSLDATQPPNTITGQVLTIGNTGGSDLTWTLNEEPVLKGAAIRAAGDGDQKSLTGSYVAFDPSAGGDTCYTPGAAGTFCFRAESYTPDYEYVYNVWEKFPTDWTVTNVSVQGTPTCTGGGTWGAFGWSFQTAPFEVNIAHSRYQSTTDHCVAYYCFDVTAGAGPADAGVSWYWDGDGYAGTPHWPCSNDGYTPAGQSACDEMINPLATVPSCGGGPVCTNLVDVPWLSETLTSGTTAGGASTPLDVIYNSTGLAPGLYSANLCAFSNDPDPGPGNGTELVVLPVTLNVSEAQVPSISLAKTVGTTPGVCPTTSSISVAAGTTVYYCYEVTNTGDVTLNLHDLTDDVLGTHRHRPQLRAGAWQRASTRSMPASASRTSSTTPPPTPAPGRPTTPARSTWQRTPPRPR